jgi:hypothetical protein
MALKKNLRADNTYLISQDTTDNPKLCAKVLSDGRESLFLDFYLGYTMEYSNRLDKMVSKKHRKKEYLSLYLWQAPRTPLERQQNKETLDLAKKIRFEKSQELLNDLEGYRLKKKQDINFLDYFQEYINNYTKKDIRMIQIAYRRFVDFLNDTPEYCKFSKIIKPQQIDKDMMIAFTEYLLSRSKGDGANTIYKRFKKVIKYAVEHDVLLKSPCNGVTIKADDEQLKKAADDIRKMEDETAKAATEAALSSQQAHPRTLPNARTLIQGFILGSIWGSNIENWGNLLYRRFPQTPSKKL